MSRLSVSAGPRSLPAHPGTAWRRRSVVAACVAGTLAALASAPTASAAPLPATCVQPAGSTLVTCTFTTVGEHELTLPEGVTSITVTAIGGAGGDADAYNQPTDETFHSDGGLGAVVTATIPVTESTVYAFVGGNGGKSNTVGQRALGGFNGGGQGGYFHSDATGFDDTGSGGGASDVRTTDRDLQSRKVIAAGGGGAGGGVPAPGGDAGGAAPDLRGYSGGQPGTATGGGYGDAEWGALGKGGDSADLGFGGGGGGGLYGGGGSTVTGGGGGSSIDPDGPGPTLAARGTPPSVTITFASTTLPTPPCSNSVCLTPGMFGSS